MKTIRNLILTVACFGTAYAPAWAQPQSTAPEFSDRVSVNEVLLDVLVTDKQGDVIVGLDQNDFIVEEDGSAVEVTGSTFYSNRRLIEARSADLGVSAEDLPQDRYFIFFLHDQRRALPQLTTRYLDLARRTEEWIRTELQPNDWLAVVGYDVKLEVFSDFSRDNEKLVKAVYEVARGASPSGPWPSRQQEAGAGEPSLLAHLASGKELRRQTRRLYSGLEVLAQAAGSVVGRKNLLFFSLGFGEATGLGTYLPDPRYYDDTMEALNDSNVAVYSISVLNGADFGGRALAEARALQHSMNVLASDTGGRSFFNHVSFGAPLEQVLEQNSGYYLLSYKSETPVGESGYRKVVVKAKNPSFKVTAREGYLFGSKS